ncbi:MAG: hypothetical protein H8E66_12155 [Planctomycetes bacterium]|nr:hypothetical protein [Planctomycetota bacterium]
MVFEHIEKLKQEYTDKYVTVDETRPELKRFGGMTGTVRTVNMSGRALVEFDAYANIGWYDIDIDFLKVIDEPLRKPDAKPAAKKSAAKASPKAAPAAKKDAAASKPASGGGMSVADMLAAARGNKSGGAAASAATPSSVAEIMDAARTEKGGGAAPAKADPKSMSVADMLAAARGDKSGGGAAPAAKAAPASAAAPKKDPKSMSVADMLAAARGEASGGGPPAATIAAPAKEDPKESVRTALEAGRKSLPSADSAVDEPVADEPTEAESSGEGGGRRDDITSVDEQIAYCRKVDAG